MTANASVKVTIAFNDPDLNAEEQDEQAQRLLTELRQMNDASSKHICVEGSRIIDKSIVGGRRRSPTFETAIAQY